MPALSQPPRGAHADRLSRALVENSSDVIAVVEARGDSLRESIVGARYSTAPNEATTFGVLLPLVEV